MTIDVALNVVVAKGEGADGNDAQPSGGTKHTRATTIAILAVTASFHTATMGVSTAAGTRFFGSVGASSLIGTNPIGYGLQAAGRFAAITAL